MVRVPTGMTLNEFLCGDVDAPDRRITSLEAENTQLMLDLESLTPRGSEFHNDPARCVAWVRERLSGVIEQVQKRKAAEAENERLRAALEAVEWVTHTGSGGQRCPWCQGIYLEHELDCMRQAALEPQKGAGDG